MQCIEAVAALPGCVEGDLPEDVAAHLETCIRCQAEAAKYRRISRMMGTLVDQYSPPPDDLLELVLDSVIDDRHRRSVRRKAAVGLGGLAIAAAGTVAGLIVRSYYKHDGTKLAEAASGFATELAAS